MSFEQISSACRGGKKPEIEIHSIEDARRINADWRKHAGIE